MDLRRHHRPRSATRPTRLRVPQRAGLTRRRWGPAASIVVGRRRPRWRKKIAHCVPLLLCSSVLAVTAYLAWVYYTLPNPSAIAQRQVSQSTKIYDRTGAMLLYEIHGERRRTSVSLDAIPAVAKNATIVAEDKDFYSHQGFDIKGMLRALAIDILRLGKVQGGSTITQQLVKNALFGTRKTIDRKVRELMFAYQIEQRFSKDQILKMYLNEIPYGRSAYGIEAAAQVYFAKSAKDLSLAQAALLAALPKAPSYYSPYGDRKDELIERQRYILRLLKEQRYITQSDEDRARAEKLVFAAPREHIVAPHFIFFIREQLERTYGEHVVEQGGLKIITTLDVEKQKVAEAAIASSKEKNTSYKATNAALVALNPANGQILAMVGSRDYFDTEHDGNVNVALRPRQPGSSFKPIVYAAAFEKGYTPETLLYDVVTTFKNFPKDYTPHNYDDKEHGLVSMRKALAGSLNIPAVKTLYLAGIDRVLELAERLGYTTLSDRSRFGLSLVLGGGEVRLLEHTSAYAVFAQEGMWHKPSGILKVEDADRATLWEWRDESRTVLDAQIARQVTSILSDNNARSFIFGVQNKLILPDRSVAAKTGTTNDYRDAWTIGYTPSVVAGVWVGNNDNAAMKRGADGSVVAAPIWNDYMRAVLNSAHVESFTSPAPSQATKPILKGEAPMSDTIIKTDRASGKLATARTPVSFIEERKIAEVHSILHYLNKDDPNGPLLQDPKIDPHYENWEAAIARYAKERGLGTGGIPTQEDDVHVEANVPTLSVDGVNDGFVARSSSIPLVIRTQSPRGVRRIELRIDGGLIQTLISTPHQAQISASLPLDGAVAVANGDHTLTIRAADDVDNIREVSFVIKVER